MKLDVELERVPNEQNAKCELIVSAALAPWRITPQRVCGKRATWRLQGSVCCAGHARSLLFKLAVMQVGLHEERAVLISGRGNDDVDP